MSYSSLTNKYIPASADNYMRGRGGYKYVKSHLIIWLANGLQNDALSRFK